jgi:O-acetylserine/cysteine efflux transporter
MTLSHLMLAYLVALIFGFNFVAAATALQHFPPFAFTVIRFVIVLLAVVPFIRLPQREQWGRLTAVALLNGAFHFSLFFLALRWSSDITSIAILLQLYVPMSALLAVILLGERVGWRTVSAIVLAFSGVLVVSLDPLVFQQLDAVALCLVSAFCLGLGTTLMRELQGINPFAFQGWTALFSIPVLMAVSWWVEDPGWSLLTQAQADHWGGALYSALISSIVGHGLLFYLVRRNPVSQVTPHLLVAPILAIGFGILFWGDEPGIRLLVGGVMVLAGVLVVAIRSGVRK